MGGAQIANPPFTFINPSSKPTLRFPTRLASMFSDYNNCKKVMDSKSLAIERILWTSSER